MLMSTKAILSLILLSTLEKLVVVLETNKTDALWKKQDIIEKADNESNNY